MTIIHGHCETCDDALFEHRHNFPEYHKHLYSEYYKRYHPKLYAHQCFLYFDAFISPVPTDDVHQKCWCGGE